jgi:hypothetical protein
VSELAALRGQGRWAEAVALTDDPLLRADLLNEQALFAGDPDARARAAVELDRAEALLLQQRGRILHSEFLWERGDEDPRELECFERSLTLARHAGDERLEAWARFWIGLVHQVVRGDDAGALPHFEAAYTVARELGDTMLAAYAVRHLAFCRHAQGQSDDAWRGLEESVDLRRADGFLPGVAAGLLTLGEIAAEEGRVDEARAFLAEARETGEACGAHAFVRRIEAVERELA